MITNELIDEIKGKLNTRASYEHFFSSINDPKWIQPLKNAGFFENPDPLVEQDGYISFPFWPESQYLLRVVEKAPDDVLNIVRDIPETDNQRVLEDIVQILLKLEVGKAVSFTDKVLAFLEKPYQLRVQDYTADLIVKFAEGGHIQPALKLSGSLLEVKPDPKLDKMSKEESKYALVDPQIKYRDYEYQQILEKITPALATADPEKSINFFSELLSKAIQYKLLQYSGSDIDDDENAWEDYSTIWRPDIAGTGRDFDKQPREGLVSALRDSLIVLLKSNLSGKQKLTILKDVSSKKYKVFKRIVEYVLRDYKTVVAYKGFYASLFKEIEPITDPALLRQDPYEFKPEADITIEELEALSDKEFIAKLKSHKPKEQWFWRDAMYDLVTALIKNNPKRYLGLADQILGTKYQYVNAIFSAATEKADLLSEEIFHPALLMGRKFLAEPRPDNNDEAKYFDWSRTALARLLEKVVRQRQDKSEFISDKTAGLVLELILNLCRDLDPTPEHEKEYGGDNMDPATLSVNSTRGEAMHALCHMLLWVKRNSPQEDMLPAIYQELSWHLMKKNDPSLAIRAVYGQWLPWIWDANKKWATANLNKIFTSDEHGDAAWDAYITLNQVFNNVFKFLEPVIRKRVAQLKKYQKDEKSRRDAKSQFAQHLMVYYWRGLVDLAKDGIIRSFFETGDVHYRSEALRFIGFELRKNSSPDKETTERLRELWNYRLKSLSSNPKQGVEELEQFGSWFASGVFEDDWSIQNLVKVLSITHNADPDFMVLERLEALVTKYPLEATNSLAEMVAGAHERWAVDSWRDNAMNILKTAYKSDNEGAKTAAKDLANKLVAQGYHMYRETVK